MPADILTFPGNPGAPVQPIIPRSSFGQRRRQVEDLAGSLERIRDILAGEARNAFDKSAVCPTLPASLASKAEMLAAMAIMLADECKGLGFLKQASTFRDLAHISETCAGELEIAP